MGTSVPDMNDRSDLAEHWFARMSSADCDAAERAAFARWREARPEHAAAYARVEQLYRRSAGLGTDPRWKALAQAARQRTARRARMRRGLRWGLPLAAAACAVLAVGYLRWDPAQPEQRYATEVGERRILTLDDGSRVVLDTDSRLVVRYSRKRRQLVLEQGQAQFAVTRQPARPFVVGAGAGEVRAVGTRFQVRNTGGPVHVTLLEGVVVVDAPGGRTDAAAREMRTATLAPGQRLSFDAWRWNTERIDPQAAQGWTVGELVFERRPLRELIDEMNRYTTTKIRLGDPALGDLKVSGAFYDNDQTSLVQALEYGWSLRAERASAGEIVLRRR